MYREMQFISNTFSLLQFYNLNILQMGWGGGAHTAAKWQRFSVIYRQWAIYLYDSSIINALLANIFHSWVLGPRDYTNFGSNDPS